MTKKIMFLALIVLFTFCKNTKTIEETTLKEDRKILIDTILDKKPKNTNYDFDQELDTNEELVSDFNFKSWKGVYNQMFEYSDNEYNEFVFNSEINLIKSDSCYFEYWYEIKDKKPIIKNNHTKIFGRLYPSSDNNCKVQFFENKMIIGISPEQSPVFTLINKEGKFYISSILTTPPHNGIVEMPLDKNEKTAP